MTPDEAQTKEQGRSQNGPEGRTTAEWISLGLGLAVLLALVGLVVYQYLTTGDDPAAIEVTLLFEEQRTTGGLTYLPIAVRNTGDRAANDVRVEARWGDGANGDGERAPVTIPFLDGGETARAVLVFSQDPGEVGVQVDVLSYIEP
jgi:uncharacterized protein (TIGR02588 family)